MDSGEEKALGRRKKRELNFRLFSRNRKPANNLRPAGHPGPKITFPIGNSIRCYFSFHFWKVFFFRSSFTSNPYFLLFSVNLSVTWKALALLSLWFDDSNKLGNKRMAGKQTNIESGGNVCWLTRANCRRAEKYGGIRWKGQCPFALVQHTEKFWNTFFQTFRAGMLFFSGGNSKRLEENIPELFSVLYWGKWALTFSPKTWKALCLDLPRVGGPEAKCGHIITSPAWSWNTSGPVDRDCSIALHWAQQWPLFSTVTQSGHDRSQCTTAKDRSRKRAVMAALSNFLLDRLGVEQSILLL